MPRDRGADGRRAHDGWDAKLAVLLAQPPAVVSFTFGCPEPGVIAALKAAGSQATPAG